MCILICRRLTEIFSKNFYALIFSMFFMVPYQSFSSDQVDITSVENISAMQQWQHLLHYRSHSLLGFMESENDTDSFFISPVGKTDLKAELIAEVALFSLKNQPDNESLQCRFPARYKWLKKFYPNWQDQSCSELKQWKMDVGAHKLTLIFPASYLNSPSSMYGHTLIRLDRKDESKSKLLSYSVNFAANADPTDNELVFSYKGLAGGYPGVVSILPYYAKVNEYSHLEHRDVWEYQLNLTEQEVDQFVNHIWETKETEFDYFFFDENCSYRLLALLDASSERIDVAKDFSLKAMPIDTIRSLIDSDKVDSVEYRASSGVMLNQQQEQLTEAQKDWAKKIVEEPTSLNDKEFNQFSEFERAQILEVSISYLRYLVVKKKQNSPENRKKSLILLSARSKIPMQDVFQPIVEPAIRDDEGHLTHRAMVAVGQQNQDEFIDVQMRIAYHELMDLPDGFIRGGQIEMGALTLRGINKSKVSGSAASEHDDLSLQLQRFSIINILSLGSRDHFQQPISWRVNTGFDRFILDGSDLFAHLDVGGGYSFDLGFDRDGGSGGKNPSDWGQVYGLLETRLKASGQFEDDYQLSAGAQVGWLYQGSQWQMNTYGSWLPSVLGDDFDYQDVVISVGSKLQRNFQLRLEGKKQWLTKAGNTVDGDSISLGLNWYF
ncbi:MAG: hypothetical protein ACI9OH_003021 [Oleispira sp.]|jgi:hypothetical protein